MRKTAMLFSALVLACASQTSKPAPAVSCTEGDSVSCRCEDGDRGEATCDEDGQAGTCECNDRVSADAAEADEPTPTPRDAGNKPSKVDAGSTVENTKRDAGSTVAAVDAASEQPMSIPRGDKTCLMGSSADFKGMGPATVKTKMVDLGGELGPYTIFYPSNLSTACPAPVIAWGNGTGVTGPSVYAHFFRHAASWGMVVIAAHNSNAGSMPFIESAIDYMKKEHTTKGSEFEGKLSARFGTSGHSQGGFAATKASSHPGVEAMVSVEGGGVPAAKVAFVCETGVMDMVREACTSSYKSAKGPSFLADHMDADHVSTPTTVGASSAAGKEFVRVFSSWFRCFLGEDGAACALFEGGTKAPLCSQSTWATCDGKNF